MTIPEPLKDPKMEPPQYEPKYYIGETGGLLGGSIFWDPLGGLG